MELLARGVKKSISKNSAHLEPFSVVFVEWVPGKQMPQVTSVVPYLYFPAVRTHFLPSVAASTIVALVDTVTQTDVPDVRLYTTLISWLQHLEQTELVTVTIVDAMVLKLFAALGVPPILSHCVVCRRSWEEVGKELLAVRTDRVSIGFSPGAGGLLCVTCTEQKKQLGEEVFLCGFAEMSALQLLLNDAWRVIDAFPLDDGERRTLHIMVLEYARYHSERAIGDFGHWFS